MDPSRSISWCTRRTACFSNNCKWTAEVQKDNQSLVLIELVLWNFSRFFNHLQTYQIIRMQRLTFHTMREVLLPIWTPHHRSKLVFETMLTQRIRTEMFQTSSVMTKFKRHVQMKSQIKPLVADTYSLSAKIWSLNKQSFSVSKETCTYLLLPTSVQTSF